MNFRMLCRGFSFLGFCSVLGACGPLVNFEVNLGKTSGEGSILTLKEKKDLVIGIVENFDSRYVLDSKTFREVGSIVNSPQGISEDLSGAMNGKSYRIYRSVVPVTDKTWKLEKTFVRCTRNKYWVFRSDCYCHHVVETEDGHRAVIDDLSLDQSVLKQSRKGEELDYSVANESVRKKARGCPEEVDFEVSTWPVK